MPESTAQGAGLGSASDLLSAQFEGLFGRERVARCYDSHDRLGPARSLLAAARLTDRARKENP